MCTLVHVLDVLCRYTVIILLAGLRSCHPVLWALLRGEPVWASALTARPSKCWREQECLQQQEHLSALTLALFPVLQELSHFPLPILHLRTTCPAYWKVSSVLQSHSLCGSLSFNQVQSFRSILSPAITALLRHYSFTHRHISHFMQHVPFPSTHRPRILVQVRFKCENECLWTCRSHELNPSPTDALML